MTRSPRTHPTDARVDEFLDSIANPERQADARTLCSLLSEAVREPPVMWGSSIIGFGSYRYRYESGHEGSSALASFSPRKPHLVVYLIGGFEERHGWLLERLGPHKTGKGCLYLKRLDDIDTDVLSELVRRSASVRRGIERGSEPQAR